VWGIFGHGNAAVLAGTTTKSDFRYYLARNEQAMVHTARLLRQDEQSVGSVCLYLFIGPGATNMITGAADGNDKSVPY